VYGFYGFVGRPSLNGRKERERERERVSINQSHAIYI